MLTDGGIFTAVAFKDLHGGTLYLDAWENKPPAIFLLLELLFYIFPYPVYVAYFISMMVILGSCICIYSLVNRYLSSMTLSILFSAIAIFFTINKDNIGDGLYTEIYGTFCLLISLACIEKFAAGGRKYYALLSFISLGSSFWFKEPFILMCIPLYFYYLRLIKGKISTYFVWIFLLLPGIIILIILWLKGSLGPYMESLFYNFQYLSHDENIALKVKINNYYENLFLPVFGLFFLSIYLVYDALKNKKSVNEGALFIGLWLASTSFVFLSPHNFGHYYFPSFVFFFIVLAKLMNLFIVNRYNLAVPVILLCIFTIYKLDNKFKPEFRFVIRHYEPDRIASFLLSQKNCTLFVDYVTRSDYYIKSEKVFPTFLPVALPIHFEENESGKVNRQIIWKALKNNTPDYLITTYTTSYFSWFLPETGFYTRNFEKIDSIANPGENIIYLWQNKYKMNGRTATK